MSLWQALTLQPLVLGGRRDLKVSLPLIHPKVQAMNKRFMMFACCLILAQAGPKGPAQVQHSENAEDLKSCKSAARLVLKDVFGGLWAPS